MQSRTFAVGTAAQLILGPGAYGALLQADPANTADIYIGGEGVTADTAETGGARLSPGGALAVKVNAQEYLYVISSASGQHLRALLGDQEEWVSFELAGSVLTVGGGSWASIYIGDNQLSAGAVVPAGTGGNNPAVAVQVVSNGSGPLTFVRTPNTFHSAVATAAGNTVVWTPAAGKKFRLQRFMLVLTDEAKQAVAGDITVKFQDATTDIGIALPVYVPAAAIAAPLGEAWSSGWIDIGNGYLSAAANNVLNVNLSTALTGGEFGILVAGTEE